MRDIVGAETTDHFDDRMIPCIPVHEIHLSDASTDSLDSAPRSSLGSSSPVALDRPKSTFTMSAQASLSAINAIGEADTLSVGTNLTINQRSKSTQDTEQNKASEIKHDGDQEQPADYQSPLCKKSLKPCFGITPFVSINKHEDEGENIRGSKITGTKRRMAEIEDEEDSPDSQRIKRHGIRSDGIPFKSIKTMSFATSDSVIEDAGDSDQTITDVPECNGQGAVQAFEKTELPQLATVSSEVNPNNAIPADVSDSSDHSTGSARSPQLGSRPSRPKVVFSTNSKFHIKPAWRDGFKLLGGSIITDIKNADILCVGDGALRKTSKLIMAVCYRVDVVSDKWLQDMYRSRKFPPPRDFLPIDTVREQEWKFKLAEAIERGKQGCNLLSPYTVYFTKHFRKEFGAQVVEEMSQVVMAMGAEKIGTRVPQVRQSNEYTMIAATKGMDDEESFRVSQLNAKMFWKDELIMGALRGHFGDSLVMLIGEQSDGKRTGNTKGQLCDGGDDDA